ncbi:MAG: amidohydrolase family protein [Halarchaeum sp.]
MPEIIDAASHIGSRKVLDVLEERHPNPEIDGLRTADRMFDVEGRVDYLDRHGIDRQVINFVAPQMFHGASPEDALEATRVANDEVRRIADEYPDRFIPQGTVPFLTGEYVDEARRCIEDLDMKGIQTWSNINGRMLDDPDFEPFWQTIDDLETPVWIHPQLADWHDYEEGMTWIYKMLGWPFDTSVAVARLIFSGVLERNPNVEIVTHHLGGTLPYLVGRLRSWYRTRREEPELYANPTMADLSEPLDAYLDRIYGDTAVSSQGETYPLECGLEFFGEDNVVYSADYPFGPDRGEYWTEVLIPLLEDLDVPDSTREKIFSGNIKRLLDL